MTMASTKAMTMPLLTAERPADEHDQHREDGQQDTGLDEICHALVLPVEC